MCAKRTAYYSKHDTDKMKAFAAKHGKDYTQSQLLTLGMSLEVKKPEWYLNQRMKVFVRQHLHKQQASLNQDTSIMITMPKPEKESILVQQELYTAPEDELIPSTMTEYFDNMKAPEPPVIDCGTKLEINHAPVYGNRTITFPIQEIKVDPVTMTVTVVY